MSYYTRLEISWDDGDYTKGTLTAQEIVRAAAPFIEDNKWSSHVLEDVEKAASGDGLSNPGFNSAYSPGVIALLKHVSTAIPDVTFYARGVGEEMDDMWFRQFRGGMSVREYGPFDGNAAPTAENPPK